LDGDNYKEAWKQEEEDGLSTIDAAFSVISSIMGSGILSVPYAITVHGLWFGIGLNLFTICAMLSATFLYMTARKIYGVNQFSDLLYYCLGTKAVYSVNLLLSFIIYVIMTLYLIMFAQIMISLFGPQGEPQSMFEWLLTQKFFYVIGLLTLNIKILLAKNFIAMRG